MADSEEEIPKFDVYTVVTLTHNRLKYTYDGYHFERSGASFQADLSDYLPIIFNSGVINKSKSRGKKQKSIDWWRAQCAFRGLTISGGMGEVQARLRSGPNTMINELVELEKKAKVEWKAQEDVNQRRALQQYRNQKVKDEQNGIDRLKPIFIDNDATAVSVFKRDCQGLGFAAQKIGLHFEWIHSQTYSHDFDSQWIIVGRTLADVDAKAAALRREREDRILAQEMQHEEKEKAARDAEAREEARLQASVADLSAKQGEWDVTGVWKVTCPDFHDRDYHGNEPPTLRIYRVNGTKVSQMFGEFDFHTVKGWLRFEDPATPSLPAPSVGRKRKRLAWDSFLIPLYTKPSPDRAAWNYRWRGRGNGGEGYMEHDSDEYQCSMTFGGKGGCTLSGTFASDFLNCKFTGVKLGTITIAEASVISIDDQWGYLYDAAYVGPPK